MTTGVKVWDPVVRAAHWLLVATVVLAWLTRRGWGSWHEWLGYGSLAVVALRSAWGCFGSKRARFTDFVRSPAITAAYTQALLAGREPRFEGHNPLGGWMVVALLFTTACVGITGWAYTTDRFWGVAWVEALHARLTTGLLWLAGLHIIGVLFASYRHKENLVGGMLHGRKRAP